LVTSSAVSAASLSSLFIVGPRAVPFAVQFA
jgi:hypothetical protein